MNRDLLSKLDELSEAIGLCASKYNELKKHYESSPHLKLPDYLRQDAQNLLNFDFVNKLTAQRKEVQEVTLPFLKKKVLDRLTEADTGREYTGYRHAIAKYLKTQDPNVQIDKRIELLENLLVLSVPNVLTKLEGLKKALRREPDEEEFYGGKGVKGKKKSQPQILKPRRNSNSQTNKALKLGKLLASKSKPPKK